MRLSRLICSALFLVAAGCADDDNSTQDGPDAAAEDVTSADASEDTTSDASSDVACQPWVHTPMSDPTVVDVGGGETCDLGPGVATVVPEIQDHPECTFDTSLAGTTLIVNALVLHEPDLLFLLDALNPLWVDDIENGTLVILFHIESHDLETGLINVLAGAGSYTDCENYHWYTDPSPVQLQTDGCNFETVAPAQLAIFPQTMSKAIIISNLEIRGYMDPATGNMPGGWLDGTLREVDTDGLDSIPLDIAVADLFYASGADPNADTDCDGEPDAWRLGGMIASTPVTDVAF